MGKPLFEPVHTPGDLAGLLNISMRELGIVSANSQWQVNKNELTFVGAIKTASVEHFKILLLRYSRYFRLVAGAGMVVHALGQRAKIKKLVFIPHDGDNVLSCVSITLKLRKPTQAQFRSEGLPAARNLLAEFDEAGDTEDESSSDDNPSLGDPRFGLSAY